MKTRSFLALPCLILATVMQTMPAAAQDDHVPTCMLKPLPADGLETICGKEDDSENVNHFSSWGDLDASDVQALSGAIGRFAWKVDARQRLELADEKASLVINGDGFCSGVLVAPQLMLTAAHCVSIYERYCSDFGSASQVETCREDIAPHRMVGGVRSALPADELVSAVTVQFGFEYAVGEKENNADTPQTLPVAFDVVAIREISTADQPDFAVIELAVNAAGETPGDLFGVRDALGSAPQTCDQVAVIHHPRGRPKRVSTGKVLPDNDIIFYNDLDTEGGSSGAPAFDMDGRLIGLHTHGGCSRQVTLEGRGFNRGHTIDALLPFSETLRLLQ